jgi:hypothetical protein
MISAAAAIEPSQRYFFTSNEHVYVGVQKYFLRSVNRNQFDASFSFMVTSFSEN